MNKMASNTTPETDNTVQESESGVKASNMPDLKPCPCGRTPKRLCVAPGSTYRWLYVQGDCGCGWMLKARSTGYKATEESDYEAAVKEWNDMERSTNPITGK